MHVAPSLVEQFLAQAGKTPDRIAVRVADGSDSLTYAELNDKSSRLASRLIGFGAAPDHIVSICLERSPRYLVALLGVLKAGAAFLPLDARYPRARLNFMVQDSGAQLLVTDSRLDRNAFEGGPRVILLDEDDSDLNSEPPQFSPIQTTPDSLAYVAYTSGSTGKPKGVLCPQSGLLNRLAWMSERFPYEPREIACQIVALSFVDSVYEIFGPLLNGIELRVIPDRIGRGPALGLMRTIERNRITRVIVVPTVLSYWLDSIAALDRSTFPLRYCFVSGEVLLASLATRFGEILPNARLINFYGSSELCHHATWFEVTGSPGNPVPIGRPIPNTEAYILDSSRKLVLNGLPGELYMGGPGMARGYLNRAELTAERFVENPSGAPGSRLFKTGDLCRYLEDGNLQYLGRIDDQVKIRGCRVEPAEVEAALRSHPAVKEAVAGAREDGRGEQRLVAWVSLRQPGLTSSADLRHFLEGTMPPYQVPSDFVFLSNFPRLPNNKINRRQLPDPVDIRSGRKASGGAPRPGIETRLAAIWEQLLDTGLLGREDDFFDLGGDSLLAARMTSLIDEQFGVMLPVDMLLDSPTLAQLAVAIEEERSSLYPRHILPIQPFGAGVRFFCFGAGPGLVPLARRLPTDQPVFGITLDERDRDWLQPGTTLEEMVRRVLPSLREFQPAGPYCVGGHSMHGLFAFEAAVQLVALGEEVAALILMDTYLPARARDRCPFWSRIGAHVSSFGERISERTPRAFVRHVTSLIPLGWSFVRRAAGKTARTTATGDDSIPTLDGILSTAEAAYVPKAYSGRVTLMEARDQIPGRAVGARFGWNYLTGAQMESRIIPGDHGTILQPPNVDALAREVAECLGASVRR